MNKIIIANWKANPETFQQVIKLAKASDFKNVVIAPPYPYLQTVSWVIKKAGLAAQDVFWEDKGPYTGEVTPAQLKSLKVKYVIVGHSERRRLLQETDEMINKKVKAALRTGLKVILCVGEDWSVRRKGITAAKKFVSNQLKKDLKLITKKLLTNNLLVAYEPVWAIGTDKADKPKDTIEMTKFIKRILDSRVLYGGSVTSKNIASFLRHKEIYGALVGGASLSKSEFRKLLNQANKL